jgi:hypothetical protein
MNRRSVSICVLTAGMLLGMAGCSKRTSTEAGVRQTGFPGQVTAGGGTSGEVLARAGRATEGKYTGGTPGIAGGSGGNTGGAATGGTVQESGHGPAGSSVPPPAGQPSGGRQ